MPAKPTVLTADEIGTLAARLEARGRSRFHVDDEPHARHDMRTAARVLKALAMTGELALRGEVLVLDDGEGR